jgi:MOSC domain-containing protein YiiM
MLAEIVSLNVGKTMTVTYNGKELSTGIYKSPVYAPVFLSKLNLDGDGQADLVYHEGGIRVFAYN